MARWPQARSAASAAVGPFVSQALAETGGTDAEILNFALTLEYLESAFYSQRARKWASLERPRSTPAKFGDEEAAHVSALTAAIKKLGGTPSRSRSSSFPPPMKSSFLKLASALENTGVGAYNGAAPSL